MPYRPTDVWVNLPALTPTKASCSISEIKPHMDKRTVAAVSLGPHVEGVAMPHPDISDAEGAVLGCRKRFATRMPQFNHKFVRKLYRYVDRWLKRRLRPFTRDHKFDFEGWLAETNYTEARKQELRDVWSGSTNLITAMSIKAASFVKDEYYPEYKYPRAINSREDSFKTFFGPVVKDIETELYKLPEFIKHVPVPNRPGYIRDNLYRQGAKIFGTDFSSFESSFVQTIMIKLEMKLYLYMCQNHWILAIITEVTIKVKAGLNVLVFKYFTVKILATRESGEMDTSCANGFSNLLINSFLLEEVCHCYWFFGVVEGDDGLFAYFGSSPTAKMYQDLGFNIKIQYFDNLFEASFCGIVFDEETLVNIACPYKNLAKFGWTTHTYEKCNNVTKLKLLRAKGLSLLYQYPGCPVMQELGIYAIRVTAGVNMGGFVDQSAGWWEREQMKYMRDGVPVAKPVEMTARLLMEKIFGMSVEEQLRIEAYLSSKTDLTPIKIDTQSFPDLWVANYYRYGVNRSEVDSFTVVSKRSYNTGWVEKEMFLRGGAQTKRVVVGYVDHKGVRYFDSCPLSSAKPPMFLNIWNG